MLLDVDLTDLNSNTDRDLIVSRSIYLQSQRRSRYVALKRAFGVYVAAVDKKRENKKEDQI